VFLSEWKRDLLLAREMMQFKQGTFLLLVLMEAKPEQGYVPVESVEETPFWKFKIIY
jgi:hypothetical protein